MTWLECKLESEKVNENIDTNKAGSRRRKNLIEEALLGISVYLSRKFIISYYCNIIVQDIRKNEMQNNID